MFRAHELIAVCRPGSPFNDDYDLLMASVKFDLGEQGELGKLAELSHWEFFELPAPICLFQVSANASDIGFFLVVDSGDCIRWTRYTRLAEEGFQWARDNSELLIRRIDGGYGFYMENFRDGIARPTHSVSGHDELWLARTAAVAASIEVFSCTNVTTVTHEPPKFINSKRARKGKVPFFSYKTLHITGEDQDHKDSKEIGGHASPRLHLRRGHIRKLADGRRIWVRHCLVGDKSQGMVTKDYKVRLAA